MPAKYGSPNSVAVIDPRIEYGQAGQFVPHEGEITDLMRIAQEARREGMEVRIYYRALQASGGEVVASQVIETWIPPGHVQPFHTHHRLHETTMVMAGEIMAIDHEEMTEQQARELLEMDGLGEYGTIVGDHQYVIEGPGSRHTVANHTKAYAVLMTVQTARIPLKEFPHDWHRDKPLAE